MQTSHSHLNVLGFQPTIPTVRSIAQRQAHVDAMIAKLETAVSEHDSIDLVLLPELATIEYSREAFDQLDVLAETRKGDSFERFAAFAKRAGCAVMYGFPRVEQNRTYISQNVINANGKWVTGFDKLHMAHFGFSMEKDYFSAGERIAVFELNGFRFGILICYDFRFPELMCLYAQQHAVDVLLHPVAFSRDESFPSWHHFAIVRALENHTYFLSLNRAGSFWGSSIFCPPWVDSVIRPKIFPTEESLVFYRLDKAQLATSRQMYPFAQDKLPAYDQLHLTN
ncbi:MAG: carbon-nitrogen hydrolase family protein [Ardenticatenaceae bacterium]